jgi:thioredoxin-like negative regulator of GroEL
MLLMRIAILVALLALIPVLVCLWRCHNQRKLVRLAASATPASVRTLVTGNAPAVLYFTAADCAQCRFQQSPLLEQFSEQMRVAIYPIDAVAQQDVARFYGVMTVPSTVLVNAQLQPVAINHGLATPDRLARQIMSIGS